MKKTALIDADIITYLAAYYSMTKFDDGEVWTDMEAAKGEVHRVVEEWRTGAECEEVLLVLSPDDRTNYRSIVWPAYKTHRKPGNKPPHIGEVAQYIKDCYDWSMVSYLEGDDVLGILHTRDPESSVIVSTDKDMMTVPGYHYNPNKHTGCGPVRITEAQALTWLYTQVLMGDSTDGYKGVKRVGPVAANKILSGAHGCELVKGVPTYYANHEMLHEATKVAYEQSGQGLGEFVENLSMARILTDDYYISDPKTVLLPTTEYDVNKELRLCTT